MTELEWVPLHECFHGDIVKMVDSPKEFRVLSEFSRWENEHFAADPGQFVLVDSKDVPYNVEADVLVCRIQRFQYPRHR